MAFCLSLFDCISLLVVFSFCLVVPTCCWKHCFQIVCWNSKNCWTDECPVMSMNRHLWCLKKKWKFNNSCNSSIQSGNNKLFSTMRIPKQLTERNAIEDKQNATKSQDHIWLWVRDDGPSWHNWTSSQLCNSWIPAWNQDIDFSHRTVTKLSTLQPQSQNTMWNIKHFQHSRTRHFRTSTISELQQQI